MVVANLLNVLLPLALGLLAAAAILAGRPLNVPGNPILADGTFYSADPAPFVANDTLYIIAGRDEAPQTRNDFIMNEWQIFSTANPASKSWTHFPTVAKPHEVFAWAATGRAYASQIVQARNGRFYLYAPVFQARASTQDKFGIGVAVSSSPTGPFRDAHPQGPIISQSTPAPGNRIQNIDPTVMIDDNGKAYIYFGTFGQLRGYELGADMITPKARTLVEVRTLRGFFEAAWLMKRKGVYYMIYAANNAGPDSPCSPTSYHACQAWGTAPSPLGPWTYRGVLLDIVSSTTSHAGAINFKGQWYLAYHTADANGGGHFRRSVALDKLEFDDSTNPPAIRKVVQTHRPLQRQGAAQTARNVALRARAASKNGTPVQYWVRALNDGVIPSNPLPPDYWSSYAGERSPRTSVLTYTWSVPVNVSGTAVAFFADQRAGSSIGVAPPASWYLEYQSGGGQWSKVQAKGAYPTRVTDRPEELRFSPVRTSAVRAVLTASGSGKSAGVGIKEWIVFSA
jgi:hypothetical protein